MNSWPVAGVYVPAMKIQLTKKYGVVRFKGKLYHNEAHKLVFESDDPLEAMSTLEEYCKSLPEDAGCMIMLRDAHLNPAPAAPLRTNKSTA